MSYIPKEKSPERKSQCGFECSVDLTPKRYSKVVFGLREMHSYAYSLILLTTVVLFNFRLLELFADLKTWFLSWYDALDSYRYTMRWKFITDRP